MSDEGYTWRDHLAEARQLVGAGAVWLDQDLADIRDALIHARASITRALLLLPAPEDKDAA